MERLTAPTAREALAKVLSEHALAERGRVWDACTCPWYGSSHGTHLADAILASPALDAIVAERVVALTGDESMVERVARGINAADDEALVRTNFEHLGATYAEQASAALRALSAVLTEWRPSDG